MNERTLVKGNDKVFDWKTVFYNLWNAIVSLLATLTPAVPCPRYANSVWPRLQNDKEVSCHVLTGATKHGGCQSNEVCTRSAPVWV